MGMVLVEAVANDDAQEDPVLAGLEVAPTPQPTDADVEEEALYGKQASKLNCTV